ncbi:unnamed protein product [Penicillium nalgiovense]|uniref:Uncharacterized protein n=1 Tax=Penicillium nalgiovense TaxID=60175 RepID=A0A9W4ILD4_PENNA|nr:unnamed protein product [Penicillium nalgiovense]CAG8079850.1 unnamed protein product [Penicillium nalgiovense]CAG8190927.1 unnamed protein product [Penicillium nalgiovense]CAG8192731.1 unnamed protein product [Penicillium nalgiovense]CAG8200214.1 unnamed protein product [Penicillium nalgiovense]
MERKLSEKATKIRRRLTFIRSSSARGLESTPVSPIDASPSSSRPRSTTNPESPTHESTWDSRDPNSEGVYSFTDEPGYFRPASPLIDRQEIEADLEADIKHACAMLSHSIDRGIPTELTYRSAMPVRTDGQNPAGQPSGDAAPSSLEQHAILLSAARPIKPETGSTTKHDSGVGTSFSSPNQPGRPYENSVSGTDTSTRFHNKQPSASPPHSASPGPRFRSQSLATTVEDNQRERANSSSPVPFPYSPPQSNSEWISRPTTLDSPVSSLNESEQKFEATESELETEPKTKSATKTIETKPETSSSAVPPQEAPYLDGAGGGAWLRASREIHLINEEKPTTIEPKTTKPLTRFYSSCNQTTGSVNSCEWPTDFREDRDPSVYGKVSPASPLGAGRATVSRPQTGNPRLATASTNEEKLSGRYPYQSLAGSGRGVSYSSSCLGDESKHQERVLSVAMPGSLSKNNRRKKASLLLRKLAGLGPRRKVNDNGNEVC